MSRRHSARLTQGRRFGLEIGGACAAIALLLWWRDAAQTARIVLLLASALLVVLAVARPSSLHGVAMVWTRVGERIAAVTSPLVLTLIYVGVFTPVGLIRRWLSRSPLHRDPDATTRWVRREPESAEARRSAMERQF